MVVPEKLLKKKLQKREEKRKAKKKAQKLERQKQESEEAEHSDSETKVEEDVQEPSRKRKQQDSDEDEPSNDGEGVQETSASGKKKKMAKKEKKQDEEQCKYLWLPNCVSNSKSLFCSTWDNGGHVQHPLGQVFCVSRSPRVRSHHEGNYRDGLYSHDRYSGIDNTRKTISLVGFTQKYVILISVRPRPYLTFSRARTSSDRRKPGRERLSRSSFLLLS